MEFLLDILERCTSISRLSLVSPSSFDSFSKIFKKEFSSRLIRLCDQLSRLAALFCYLNMPFEKCQEANLALNKKLKMERPAFRVDIRSMMKQNGQFTDDGEIQCSYFTEFPSIYSDLFTSCQSQVVLFPQSCNTFLIIINMIYLIQNRMWFFLIVFELPAAIEHKPLVKLTVRWRTYI